MSNLQLLKGCELHVHAAGCLYPDDLLSLAKDYYREIDWERYIEQYEAAYGVRPDPRRMFEEALATDSWPNNNWPSGHSTYEQFHEAVVYGAADGGDFGRFTAKIGLIGAIYVHYRTILKREDEVMAQIIDRHRSEGVDFVEYRAGPGNAAEDPEGFLTFHRRHAQAIASASGNGITARYMPSIPRDAPLIGYELIQRLFDENPETIPVTTGIDFCAVEEGYPPSTVHALFKRLHKENAASPERALDVGYHVGESYFDKSLESAVRWCHEVAEMGAKRLGHATALGLDPAVAIGRRLQAHEAEFVSERLAQINYDLTHREALAEYGVTIDVAALEKEGNQLQKMAADELVSAPYSPARLADVRRRQDYVLDQLTALGTVIETCPTSNLRIGGVPSPADHPIHRLLRSNVNLAICADDPGLFDSPLSAEIDWVLQHTGLSPDALLARLGDPRRFRFGQLRPA